MVSPKPVPSTRCVSGQSAAIWKNQTENGVRHNVTFSRLYKQGDTWQQSTSFGRDDLPLIAKVADLAHLWIFQHGQETENGQ